MNPTPTIELSPDTGTITNALDLAAWLRHHSPAWATTEAIAQKHRMTGMDRLEFMSLTLGLQLEQARQRGFDSCPPKIDMTPLLPGFEMSDATRTICDGGQGSTRKCSGGLELYEQTTARLDRTPGDPLPWLAYANTLALEQRAEGMGHGAPPGDP